MEQLDDDAVNIFTDGSAYSGPRRGGTGVLFVTVDDAGNEQVHEFGSPGYEGATNNQMELQACIEALRIATGRRSPVDLSKYRKIVIRTDSMYVAENFDTAKFGWPRTRWTTKDGAPVLNVDLWKELMRMVTRAERARTRVEVKWVRGKRSPHTKAVDKVAKRSAKSPRQRRVSVVRVRRKKSPKSLDRGSVKMQGQRATVRIVTDEYLKAHRCYKYIYEVMSKRSPYYQCVDVIFSEIMLGAGHTYYVRFNDDTKNPRIVKCFREVQPS